MAFKSKGRDYFKTRVYARDGSSIVAGCGTSDLATANAMEQMARTMRRRREWKPLELIVSRKATLPEIFDAHESGKLSEYLASQDSPDLIPLLDEWAGNAKYKTQVRRMIGPAFSASRFTRRAVSEFLAGLKVSGSTKNRYRAALSVFAGWLVEREILEHNPVRDVRAAKPNAGRMLWLERNQAKALIGALPMPYRAIEALMAATGVEWQVIERVRRRDIDFKAQSFHAQGSKTAWRNRTVRGTESWAWKIFADYAKGFTPNACIFGGVSKYAALRKHQNASKVLGLPQTTLHDWRHVYAVQALRDGYRPAVVAHQLGHRDAHLVSTRYGRYVPDERDYTIHAAVPFAHASGRGE